MSSLFNDINARQLPKMMKYSELTPLGISCSAKKIRYFPIGGNNYGPGNNIVRIALSSSSAFLDPSLTCLKFKYTNTHAGETSLLDGSAHSFISRIRITSQSSNQDLEDIRHYNQLHALLSDATMGLNTRFTKSYEGYGYGGFLQKGRSPVVAQVASANGAVAKQDEIKEDLTGSTAESMGFNEPTFGAGTGGTFCIPLISSLIGTSAKKYLPLFLTGQIMLEIEINPFATYCVNDVAPKFIISDIELQCQMVEFNSDINNSLKTLCFQTHEPDAQGNIDPSGLYLHCHQWSSYLSSSIAGLAAQSMMISERLKSVKSVLVHFNKKRTNQTRAMARYNSLVKDFQIKIGSSYYPDQAIVAGVTKSTNSDYLTELYKSLGCYTDINHNSIINSENFESAENGATKIGRSAFGLDLDGFSVSADNNIESGVNCILNNPMIITMNTSGPALECDMYVHLLHDALIKIGGDGRVTKSS